jgi:hypothetical protein
MSTVRPSSILNLEGCCPVAFPSVEAHPVSATAAARAAMTAAPRVKKRDIDFMEVARLIAALL